MLWNCATVPEGLVVWLCCVALPEGFAVGCEDSEDTGFCPLRIMWCAPEHSIFSIYRFWEKRQLPANPVKSMVTAIL